MCAMCVQWADLKGSCTAQNATKEVAADPKPKPKPKPQTKVSADNQGGP